MAKPPKAQRSATRSGQGSTTRKARSKNPAAVALGKLGGKKGGPARAKALSANQRRDIARKAAKMRWRSKKNPQG